MSSFFSRELDLTMLNFLATKQYILGQIPYQNPRITPGICETNEQQ